VAHAMCGVMIQFFAAHVIITDFREY
jgi:hypothetical protein